MIARLVNRIATLGLSAMLAACAGPEPPDWKTDAGSASERFVEAWLAGDTRVEKLEFERARDEVARTGRADLVGRVELLRCATRVASLVLEPCSSFDALRASVEPGAEVAYADYLAGRVWQPQIALLPEAQRQTAAAMLADAEVARGSPLLDRIGDPLSRLVAAGVMYRAGRATDAVVATAVETASAQGWRRPLLAWLMVQARRADGAGDAAAATAARRRIDLVAPDEKDRPAPPP